MNTFLVVSNVVLWVLLIAQLIVFFFVTRWTAKFVQNFQVAAPGSQSKSAPVVGSRAPLFSEEDHRGDIVTLNKSAGRRTLLLFTLDTCSICQQFMEELPTLWQRDADLRIVVVAPEDLAAPDKEVPQGVSFIRSHSLMENYMIQQVPFAVLINSQGYIEEAERIANLRQVADKLPDLKRSAG